MNAPYDHRFPRRPVPLWRCAEIATKCAARWWDLYTSVPGAAADPSKQLSLFDIDYALAEIRDVMNDLAELSQLVGEDRARAFIANALERARRESGREAAS